MSKPAVLAIRAISMERLSRTVIEATTSPRASFSLTLLRRMSLAGHCQALLPCGQFAWPDLRAGGMIARHSTPQGSECHELRYQLQVGQRPGFARGVAGPGRARRLLPTGRPVRDDRPDLQPHHRAHPRHRAPADQPLWPALQGDHRVEPGQDRRRGRDHRQARHRLRHQQVRLCDPRRDPQGAARSEMRAAHPHPRRHRGVGDELRAPAAVADLDPLSQPHRLSRLRGPGGRSRGARADRQATSASTTRWSCATTGF